MVYLIVVAVSWVTSARAQGGRFLINGADVDGIEKVIQLKPEYGTPDGLAELQQAFEDDGLDEIVYLERDSTLWLASGKHINLYARSADRVQWTTQRGRPVRILLIDDESAQTTVRPPMTIGFIILLIVIALTGLAVGLGLGVYTRRHQPGIPAPVFDRAMYGFLLGILAALLVYGLSNHQLDLVSVITHVQHDPFRTYRLDLPPE